MRNYVGPLLDTLVDVDELTEEPVEPMPCEDSGWGWGHSGAIHLTISEICVGRHVRLVRRKLMPNATELPGEVAGHCIGSSHQAGGRVTLGLQLDDGTVVGVDVSCPSDWSWEVTNG